MYITWSLLSCATYVLYLLCLLSRLHPFSLLSRIIQSFGFYLVSIIASCCVFGIRSLLFFRVSHIFLIPPHLFHSLAFIQSQALTKTVLHALFLFKYSLCLAIDT